MQSPYMEPSAAYAGVQFHEQLLTRGHDLLGCSCPPASWAACAESLASRHSAPAQRIIGATFTTTVSARQASVAHFFFFQLRGAPAVPCFALHFLGLMARRLVLPIAALV